MRSVHLLRQSLHVGTMPSVFQTQTTPRHRPKTTTSSPFVRLCVEQQRRRRRLCRWAPPPHTSRAQPHGVISAVKPSSPAVHLLSLHGRTKKQQVLVFVKATISYRPKVHDTVNYKFAIGRLTSVVSSFYVRFESFRLRWFRNVELYAVVPMFFMLLVFPYIVNINLINQ